MNNLTTLKIENCEITKMVCDFMEEYDYESNTHMVKLLQID